MVTEDLDRIEAEVEAEIQAEMEQGVCGQEQQPFSQAHITLCVGDQGSGKSTIITARAVDATFAKVTSVILDLGLGKHYEVKSTPALNERGKPIIGYVTVHFPNKAPFIAKVPDNGCVVADRVRVFANYTLYGIRYMHCDLATILENINNGLLIDGYVNIDEAYMDAGDSRNSMSVLNQIMTADFGMTIRKRRLNLQVAYPLAKMADSRFRQVRTEFITATYNKNTCEVTAEIKRNKEKRKSITFYAPTYWPYYNTDERFRTRESKIAKAMKQAY